MHYCFLSSGTWEGNASFVRLREFGAEMLKRELRVSFIVDDLPYNSQKLQLPAGADVRFVPAGGFVSQSFARRKIIRELNPDFVHVLNPYIKAFAALALMQTKVVGDWDEWPARRPLPFVHHWKEKFLDRWLRNRGRVIVVASKFLQGEFKRLFNLDAVYIPYATYLQQEPDAGSPFDQPTAVYVGNFYPAYDHDLVFEAIKILKNAGRPVRLAHLGGGPDLEKWRSFLRKNSLDEFVKLPGFVSGSELWRALRGAHVLLFPIRENLLNLCRCPSKTYAYAQSRRPIIANRVGEVAQVLGEKATYIEPTAAAFAMELDRVMNSPRAGEVDYAVEQQNWSSRTETLLAAVGGAR